MEDRRTMETKAFLPGEPSFSFSHSSSVFFSGKGVNFVLTLSSTPGIFKNLFCITSALQIFNVHLQM